MASSGVPDLQVPAICGRDTAVLRRADCANSDHAERKFDKHVNRANVRPLTGGKIRDWQAVMVVAVLELVGLMLLLARLPISFHWQH